MSRSMWAASASSWRAVRCASQPEALPNGGSGRTGLRPGPMSIPDLDLHGMRVDEALAAVDRHIDRAILAELDHVRFIHGFGTLRLRNAIREHLRDRPEVAKLSEADPFSRRRGA